MNGRIGVLELPASWQLPRLSAVTAASTGSGYTAISTALNASNAPSPLQNATKQLPPPPPAAVELNASLLHVAQASASTYAAYAHPSATEVPTCGHTSAPTPYFSDWDSDPDEEPLSALELMECERRFIREGEQVERNASLFAALHPAHNHTVLPEHQRLLDMRRDALGLAAPAARQAPPRITCSDHILKVGHRH